MKLEKKSADNSQHQPHEGILKRGAWVGTRGYKTCVQTATERDAKHGRSTRILVTFIARSSD